MALVAMGGALGLSVDLASVPAEGVHRDDTLLFSESAGRFIVTVAPADRAAFESCFRNLDLACVGEATQEADLRVRGLDGQVLFEVAVPALKAAWKGTFGDLI